MISKCANPDCTQGFDHRQGRLMRFHNDAHPDGEEPGSLHCIRHFWLCDPCSRTYTLEYQTGMGVVIRSRFNHSTAQPAPRLVCDCPAGRRSACCLG